MERPHVWVPSDEVIAKSRCHSRPSQEAAVQAVDVRHQLLEKDSQPARRNGRPECPLAFDSRTTGAPVECCKGGRRRMLARPARTLVRICVKFRVSGTQQAEIRSTDFLRPLPACEHRRPMLARDQNGNIASGSNKPIGTTGIPAASGPLGEDKRKRKHDRLASTYKRSPSRLGLRLRRRLNCRRARCQICCG